MTVKGTESKTINIIIGLVIAIAIASLFLALFLPSIMGADDAASCVGLLRNVGSIIADMTGRSIC
ncbi:hypothetical protein HRED_01686 [Candidatus Haloredivivus sp. G17]|jgi:uncharacterized membrane protein YccC|nr:hypothetical protein HRED_01686 [Candidatus Haloredivivus sp. G17]